MSQVYHSAAWLLALQNSVAVLYCSKQYKQCNPSINPSNVYSNCSLEPLEIRDADKPGKTRCLCLSSLKNPPKKENKSNREDIWHPLPVKPTGDTEINEESIVLPLAMGSHMVVCDLTKLNFWPLSYVYLRIYHHCEISVCEGSFHLGHCKNTWE